MAEFEPVVIDWQCQTILPVFIGENRPVGSLHSYGGERYRLPRLLIIDCAGYFPGPRGCGQGHKQKQSGKPPYNMESGPNHIAYAFILDCGATMCSKLAKCRSVVNIL